MHNREIKKDTIQRLIKGSTSYLNDPKKYNGILLTFGCSWTHGDGAAYTDGMDTASYAKISGDVEAANMYSFRSLLAKKFNLFNLNFSLGGSSNQKQFRHARELFSSPFFQNTYADHKIIALWGITSTARNELWSNDLNEYFNFMYDGRFGTTDLMKQLLVHSYNHAKEIEKLEEYMFMWNDLFKLRGIPNIWFDTFNTHDYDIKKTDNLIVGDMMTAMTDNKLDTEAYHLSNYKNDDPRLDFLIERKLMNPISYHPTKLGYKKIADILSPYIEKLI